MNIANPLVKDDPAADPGPHEPSMTEILASIRRIIADDQALSASFGEVPRAGPAAEVFGPGSQRAARGASSGPLVSGAVETSVASAFNALLASRFARHGDVVAGLTREMLRPMVKAWLDDNLPSIVERLVCAEIERITRSE
ncbi:MAG: DUF2497 domain-containing protein [Beijerinckiaceae bacterium]|nr:DUF2497 domain-containing protein [Beijerinckiaceae bacterium]